MYSRNDDNKLLPVIVIVGSVAAAVAAVVLAFYGIYFFLFVMPLAFGLPWSIKKLVRNKARKQWKADDLR